MMIDPPGDMSCVNVLYGMVVLGAGFEPTPNIPPECARKMIKWIGAKMIHANIFGGHLS
jgi:hypothetical protein